MNQQEHALTIFAEELSELATEFLSLQKQTMKALRFGIDEQRDLPTSNRDRIEAEWQDLLGSVEHMRKHGISLTPDLAAIRAKLAKIDRYCDYAESLGALSHNEPLQATPRSGGRPGSDGSAPDADRSEK